MVVISTQFYYYRWCSGVVVHCFYWL